MSKRVFNAIRSFDQLGVPVTLNLNKQGSHQTFLGGCCSILAIILIMFVFVSTTLAVFVEFNYDIAEEVSYLRLSDGHEPFEISTESVVPAL